MKNHYGNRLPSSSPKLMPALRYRKGSLEWVCLCMHVEKWQFRTTPKIQMLNCWFANGLQKHGLFHVFAQPIDQADIPLRLVLKKQIFYRTQNWICEPKTAFWRQGIRTITAFRDTQSCLLEVSVWIEANSVMELGFARIRVETGMVIRAIWGFFFWTWNNYKVRNLPLPMWWQQPSTQYLIHFYVLFVFY